MAHAPSACHNMCHISLRRGHRPCTSQTRSDASSSSLEAPPTGKSDTGPRSTSTSPPPLPRSGADGCALHGSAGRGGAEAEGEEEGGAAESLVSDRRRAEAAESVTEVEAEAEAGANVEAEADAKAEVEVEAEVEVKAETGPRTAIEWREATNPLEETAAAEATEATDPRTDPRTELRTEP